MSEINLFYYYCFFSNFKIDFAAVLLNLRTGSIEHEYRAIVRPTHFPQLSRGCMDKLGISQNHFNGARTLSMVLADFSNWLANIMRSCDVVMPETDVLYQGRRYMVLCTWSHSDLGTFLFNEANMKRIPVPEALKYWTDAQKVFRVSVCSCAIVLFFWQIFKRNSEFY